MSRFTALRWRSRRVLPVATLGCLILVASLGTAPANAGPVTDRLAQWMYLRQAKQMAEPPISTRPRTDSMVQRMKSRLTPSSSAVPKKFKMKTTPLNLNSGTMHR